MEPTTLSNASATQIIKTAIPTAIIGAALGASASGDIPAWLQKMAQDWGPGFVLWLGFFFAVIYYLPRDVLTKFVDAHQAQAVAISSISRSLEEMSGNTGKLEMKIDAILAHQEQIKIELSVGADRFKRLEEHLLYDPTSRA